MANELIINHSSGSTLYALLFDATGNLWNGSSFVAPASADWLNYDIAMSEVATATGVYRGTMPAAAAGVYGWVVYKQKGASPAVTDGPPVGTGKIEWTGTAEIMPASTTNITGGVINSVTGSVGSVANAETIADEVLKRDWTAVTGEASRSLLNALRFLRNKWSISGTTLTVTEEDDSTPAWTATLTSDAAADPVTGSDPI